MGGEENVYLETIVWPGGDIVPVSTGRGSRSIFRIVTAFAPPFVMIGELDEDGQCLRGNKHTDKLISNASYYVNAMRKKFVRYSKEFYKQRC